MRHSGFSLLELSIVLVIIGLLAGGVMTGQALIRAAESRAVMTDLTRFNTAMFAFRDKYQAVPGDMKNATAFWGAASSNATTCKTTQGTGTQTCNGNGDGMIGEDWNDLQASAFEAFRVWQHLANAGLIEGNYTGVQRYSGSNFSAEPGVNVPGSKLTSGAYMLFYLEEYNQDYFTDAAYNTLWVGAYHGGWFPDQAILTPTEAWNIDKKIDDGKPGTGNIMTTTATSTVPNCTTGTYNAPAAAAYALTTSGPQCLLFEKIRS